MSTDAGAGGEIGRHVLADLLDVPEPRYFAADFLAGAFRDALASGGATIRRFIVEEFDGGGLSILVVLAESHASLHTWPERRAILVDVFTCGPLAPLSVVEHLAARLGGSRLRVATVERGVSAAPVG